MRNALKSFVLKYLLTAIIGSLLIAYAAPLIQFRGLPPFLSAAHRRLQSLPVVHNWSAALRTRLLSIPPALQPEAPAAPDQNHTPDLESIAPQPPPSAKDAVPTACTPRWAVVNTPRTPIYNTQGKFICRLEAGSLLEVSDFLTCADGKFALCRPKDMSTCPDTVLVPVDHLDFGHRSLDDAAARRELELLVARARLKLQLAPQTTGSVTNIRWENPYASGLAAARSEYQAYWKIVRELQQKRDAANGEERMRCQDELARLRGLDRTLAHAYKAAKEKYDAWNEAHPGESLNADRIRQLENQLARINAELNALGRKEL